ncbi:helix-turn-helix domain-containing protein [Streptomyces lavendofoliae]|uniref:helix-turn-helix domain-containing protein n=1 Tax=Streptomyces lavendofoliae TaxID=67314 RepID=UPI003D93A40B
MDTQQVSAPSRAPSRLRGRVTGSGVVHVKAHHTSRFTVVGNHLAQHGESSLTAIGLAVHIQSRATARAPLRLRHRFRRPPRRNRRPSPYRGRPRSAPVRRSPGRRGPTWSGTGWPPTSSPGCAATTPGCCWARGTSAAWLPPWPPGRSATRTPTPYVRHALTADLPDRLRQPAGLLAHRLTALLPPPLPTAAPKSTRDPFQTCDSCERAFRAPEPDRCRDCRPRLPEAA